MKIHRSLKKQVGVGIHEALHGEFQRFKKSHSLTSEEVITRGIQLVQQEFREIGKAKMLSKLTRNLSNSILKKINEDIEKRQIQEWEIENGTKY